MISVAFALDLLTGSLESMSNIQNHNYSLQPEATLQCIRVTHQTYQKI